MSGNLMKLRCFVLRVNYVVVYPEMFWVCLRGLSVFDEGDEVSTVR
jgi:hypothetical protein